MRLKAIRRLTLKCELIDLKGWMIPAGTTIHIMKQGPSHPRDGHRCCVVRVHNGTSDLRLMPETVVDLPKGE